MKTNVVLQSKDRELFGITIKKADGKVEIWNSDVSFFDIYDSVSSSTVFLILRIHLTRITSFFFFALTNRRLVST